MQPVSLGTTNYTTDFEMDSSDDSIVQNSVTTTDPSGTIYFNVYAGLNLADGASAGGVGTAELNFTSNGVSATAPRPRRWA